ncbi:MAG: ABC transporter ATP-binding protein [Acidobacteriota bacterium]|nr:ABC transporter ATP-binding protein [Acidobacteriota bacterium]
MQAVLEVSEVTKIYRGESHDVRVLDGVNFNMDAGESIAVVGPSGSGKTTLLSICAGLDLPTSGSIQLLGEDLTSLNEDGRARLRNEKVGFIFQSFHLMPSLNALENVMLPLELLGGAGAEREATRLLEEVGLGDRLDHYPSQLSGGEQQRVAIARAFINRPNILFADEPTGNLDRETSSRITDLLFALNRDKGTTLLLITHDEALADMTGRVFHMDGGRVKASIPKPQTSSSLS